MDYSYKRSVLAKLVTHGVIPRSTTPPELVREFVNDLYCYELRALRSRLLRGEFQKHTYAPRVVALRERYSVLALTPQQFVE